MGNGDALETTIGTLDVDNLTSGNIEFAETDGVIINKLAQATADNIILNSTTGTVTVAAGQSGVTTVAVGTILLFADGGDAGDLIVNDTVTSASGSITLRADDDVTFSAAGDVTSTSGNVEVTADFDGGAASGALFMANGTVIDAGSGLIDLNADENITIGQLITTSASLIAVTIDSTEGGLVDGGDTGGVDIDALNGRVVINTVTGIGSADAIETTVSSLDMDNATSGDIQIIETDAVTVFDAQQATAGNISIVAGGTITVSELTGAAVTVISTVASGTILLDANGATSDIVLNDAISSASGSITLTADRSHLGQLRTVTSRAPAVR